MEDSLLCEDIKTMNLLKEKHGDVYFEMLGDLVLGGMDIHTAIWECWNKLECI